MTFFFSVGGNTQAKISRDSSLIYWRESRIFPTGLTGSGCTVLQIVDLCR